MSTHIYWFRHAHEHRNNLLRFGLMRLKKAGKIDYTERPLKDCISFGFSPGIIDHPYLWHKSFILVQSPRKTIRCIVGNEDSFVFVSDLIKEVDMYFCAGYNSDLFERKKFVKAYCWQDETDLKWYRENLRRKINDLGSEFYKVKKFIPIAPNLTSPVVQQKYLKQKITNLEHKVRGLIGAGSNYQQDFLAFEKRYSELLSFRDSKLRYDIILNDSLWGWPQHRTNLHLKLKELANKGREIHSILKWSDPVIYDGSIERTSDKNIFPLISKELTSPYEAMISQSRMAVFACGFHWGWRSIMMFSLMAGVPVVTDRLLTEPYFDMNEFKMWQIEDHKWNNLEEYLFNIDESSWGKLKTHNQQVYDKYLSPEAVGNYFVNTVLQ